MNNKLVILTQYYPPEMGAPQSRLYETVQGLKKRGWEVRVITAMPNYPTGKIFSAYKNKLYCKEAHDDVTVIRTWIYASNSRRALPRIISMLSFSFTCLFTLFSLIRYKPKFIFTESPPLTLALSGIFLARCCGAKHIMNVSDIWPLSAYELGAIRKGKLYSMLERIERFCYRHSWAATGQSDEIVEHIKKHDVKHVHLYRNGVDVNRFANVSRQFKKYSILKIVYTGLLGVAQGIYELCKNVNFKSLGAEFHIYGDGTDKEAIIQWIEQNPDNGIYYHHRVNRDEIPNVLSQYDCTIIPLIKPIYGAVPSKIYEAMAAGLPIIFSGGGEGAKIISKHQCGWVCEPNQFEQIKQTIASVAQLSEHELSIVSANCIEAARKYFDREIQINQLHQFLTSL